MNKYNRKKKGTPYFMWKIFNFKKPTSAQIQAARQVQAAHDRAQAAEKTLSSIEDRLISTSPAALAAAKALEDRASRHADAMEKLNRVMGTKINKDTPKPEPVKEAKKEVKPAATAPEAKPAIEAQTTRFTPGIEIVDTSVESQEPKIELPFVVNCPNESIRYEINSENKMRLKHGWEPFTTYEQWRDLDKVGGKVFTSPEYMQPAVLDGTANPKVSNSPVYFVASQRYYLMFDNGKVYFLKADDVAFNNVPVILRSTEAGTADPSVVFTKTKFLDTGRDLSQSEFQDILKAKPDTDTLLKTYAQYSNGNGYAEQSKSVLMNLSNEVKTVW